MSRSERRPVGSGHACGRFRFSTGASEPLPLAQRALIDVLAAGGALRQNPQHLAQLQPDGEGLRGKRPTSI
jgi:hypothetical protein